ncbi:MAG TPA: APC family permease [Gemmatimonadaceae bacterium]|nr:APC family permease [Gemmatimonadaceae bacterium]
MTTTAAVAEVPTRTNRLQRSLGMWFGIAVGVGGMIGAGILRAPADVAARLPSPALFLGAWVLGGLYALLGANAIAELATIRPRSGGQYVFVREALGPYAGFIVGWNDWLSSAASVSAVAIVASEAIAALVPSLSGQVLVIALFGVVVTTVVLVRGIRESDRAQRWTSVMKAMALLILIVACFSWRALHRTPAPTTTAALAIPGGLALVAAMAAALQGVIFAYDGWTGIVYYSGEVVNPGREIPRALAGGLVSTIVLYLLINAAFLAVLPLSGIAASPLAAAGAASVVFGSNGGMVVQGIIAVALPSALVANALNASRVIFAMSEDRLAPAWFARVNRGGTPDAALLVTAVIAALFLLTGTFERLIAICTFLFVASYALSFTSVFVLRHREPDAPRPYRAWGHPWTTAAVLLGSLAFLGATLVADPRGAAIVGGLLVVSYPAFRFITRRRS